MTMKKHKYWSEMREETSRDNERIEDIGTETQREA